MADLNLESCVTIQTVRPLRCKGLVLDKEYARKLSETVDVLKDNFLGGYHCIKGIERTFIDVLNGEDNRLARSFYGHENFREQNYLVIKQVGPSEEESAWWKNVCELGVKEGKMPSQMLYDGDVNHFYFLRQDSESPVLEFGVFEVVGGEVTNVQDLMEFVYDWQRPVYNLDDDTDRAVLKERWEQFKLGRFRNMIPRDVDKFQK